MHTLLVRHFRLGDRQMFFANVPVNLNYFCCAKTAFLFQSEIITQFYQILYGLLYFFFLSATQRNPDYSFVYLIISGVENVL